MHKIHYKDIISSAWSLFKKHWGFLLGLLFILAVLSFIDSLIQSMFVDENKQLTVSWSVVIGYGIIGSIIGMIIQLGVITIALNIVRGAEVRFNQLIGDIKLVIPFFLGSLLYMVVILVGFVLLIVPAVIWGIKYGQMFYLIVDKRMGVMDAFHKSGEMTYGSKLDIFVLWIIFMLLIIASAIPLGLGLFITIPMSMLLPALVYTKLLGASQKSEEVPQTFEQSEGEVTEAPPTPEG